MPALTGVLQTERLRLRRLSFDDTAFIVELLNDPDFLRFIGDKEVRGEAEARAYLRQGPLASYRRGGLGLLRVELRDVPTPIGTCGLLERPYLPDPDLGFAFLPAFRSQGYASEAARAVLDHARRELALPRVLAIVDPANAGSIRVLERSGLRFARAVEIPGDDQPLSLYTTEPTDP